MEDAALTARSYAGNRAFFRMTAGAPGKQLIDLPGVSGVVTPAAPDRSVVNCVSYDEVGALAAALDTLAATYRDAGVVAWTVWVPESDRDAAGLLAAAGHVLDGRPAVMGAPLEGIRAPDPGDLEVERGDAQRVVGELNDLAYGYEDSFTRAMEGVGHPLARTYLARWEGEPACCVMTLDVDDDAHVALVATAPAAQRQGLAGRLLGCALSEARERGLATTTLVASPAGYPVYARMGYRTMGAVEMWERRTA
jgi:ribosomal protein S18 acetylase RimI-like enzyme